jgi:DNA invertase Pin-like site-specific DNA recombinase
MTPIDTRKVAITRAKSVKSDAVVRRVSGVLRAVGYARVSTEYQVEKLSFDWQSDEVRRVVEGHGWSLVDVIRERGSGKSVRSRRELSRLLEGLDAGEFDVLVVAKLDRLSRSTLDFYALMDRAKRNGWAVVSISPAVDMTTPFGRALAGMAAIFAELEREMIGQRQRESVEARKARGVYKPPPLRGSVLGVSPVSWSLRASGRLVRLRGSRPRSRSR